MGEDRTTNAQYSRKLRQSFGVGPARHECRTSNALVWLQNSKTRVLQIEPGDALEAGKWIRTHRLVIDAAAKHFVIADEHVHFAAGRFRFPAYVEQEIEYLTFVVTAAKKVAQLHDRERFAYPLIFAIRGASQLECLPGRSDVRVKVSNRDETSARYGAAGGGAAPRCRSLAQRVADQHPEHQRHKNPFVLESVHSRHCLSVLLCGTTTRFRETGGGLFYRQSPAGIG